MGQGVHTGCSGEGGGERVHQFGVNDGYGGDVVGVDAYHLFLLLLVDNHIVDSGFGGGAGGGGESYDGHALMACGGAAFKRNDVGKFGVVDDDADAFGGIDG